MAGYGPGPACVPAAEGVDGQVSAALTRPYPDTGLGAWHALATFLGIIHPDVTGGELHVSGQAL